MCKRVQSDISSFGNFYAKYVVELLVVCVEKGALGGDCIL
jgi:hypothetical protein